MVRLIRSLTRTIRRGGRMRLPPRAPAPPRPVNMVTCAKMQAQWTESVVYARLRLIARSLVS